MKLETKYYNLLLKLEANGEVVMDIGHRGGNYGLADHKLVAILFEDKPDDHDMILGYIPKNYGVYCNYLGGGLRGAIAGSGYGKELPDYAKERLDAFAKACKRRYNEIEDGEGLNSDYPDGETNWDARGTKAIRKNGIVSAY